jgi:hypothetical protein
MAEFTCQNCGRCCGIIPVNSDELRMIRRAVRQFSQEEVARLQNQKRESSTCPLRDVENNRCSVYEARPQICRMQGLYVGMSCPHNPSAATRSREEGYKALRDTRHTEGWQFGLLAFNLGWDEILWGLPGKKVAAGD